MTTYRKKKLIEKTKNRLNKDCIYTDFYIYVLKVEDKIIDVNLLYTELLKVWFLSNLLLTEMEFIPETERNTYQKYIKLHWKYNKI